MIEISNACFSLFTKMKHDVTQRYDIRPRVIVAAKVRGTLEITIGSNIMNLLHNVTTIKARAQYIT